MSSAEHGKESRLTEEAADWQARLRSGSVPEVEQVRCRAWLSGDPGRRREFDALSSLWDKLEGVAQSPEVLAERRRIARAGRAGRTSRRAMAGWALAAGVAGVAGFLSWQRMAPSTEYATGVGEQSAVQLADGSVITLNTSSRVSVRLSGGQRRVEILRGQANFEVAKDPSRPFIVRAGNGEVRALGTAFDVYERGEDTVVTLEFGSQSFPTSEVRENKGTLARMGLFSYSAFTTLRYGVPALDVALKWRRLPSVRNASYVTDPLTPFAGAASYSVFDLSAGWSPNGVARLTLGIDNLFDRGVLTCPTGGGSAGEGLVYDRDVQTAPTTHLSRATDLDAAGDHDGAINELALGTGRRDLRCTRELGLRLLTGDRAPFLPTEGLRFLGEACDGGLGEAAARAAGILALGVRVPANWPLALAWLCRSAAAGWEPAQRQMLALCDDRALAADARSAPRVDWRSLAAAVRLEAWRHAPRLDVKSAEPGVCAVPAFIRPEVCELLISMATGRLVPARVYDPVRREDIVAAHRNNTIATFDVPTVELVHALLQARMSAACGVSERMMEAPSVLHYAPGEQIQNHYDFVDPKSTDDYAGEIARNGQRIITFLVYLNDDYDGGETAFPGLGLVHKGHRGEGLYFVNALPDLSPDMRALHAGRPTTRGEKWIVTQFVRSRPTR